MDVIIDTKGEADLAKKERLLESDEDDVDFEKRGSRANVLDLKLELELLEKEPDKKKQRRDLSKDIDLDDFEKDMGWRNKRKRQPQRATNISTVVTEVNPIDKVLQKSVIKPGFEQLEAVPPYDESKRQLQMKRRKERAKTAGKQWFNMPAPEMTEEVKHDLEVIQMRSALDPKHFYKKNDLKVLPKYFQVGKVVNSPLDYYSARMTKKERKRTIVEELMADAEFSKYNKRKYKEIIEEKKKLHYKAHRHAKKLKGKKK